MSIGLSLPHSWLVLAAFLLAAERGSSSAVCLDNPSDRTSLFTVNIGYNNWLASRGNAEMARIVLEERMGYGVTLVDIGSDPSLERVASGELHAVLEVWASKGSAEYAKFVATDKAVKDLGDLGTSGLSGWFVNRKAFTLAQLGSMLSSTDWLTDSTVLNTFSKKIWQGSSGWSQSTTTSAMVKALSLAASTRLVMSQTSHGNGEAALLTQIRNDAAAGSASLYDFYEPHSYVNSYNLSRVYLPPVNQACLDAVTRGEDRPCDFAPVKIYKIVNADIAHKHPAVFDFLDKFRVEAFDQTAIMEAFHQRGESVPTAACNRLKSLTGRIAGWVQSASNTPVVHRVQGAHEPLDVIAPGEDVVVFGENFMDVESLRCKIGSLASKAAFISTSQIVCSVTVNHFVPNRNGLPLSISVSNNDGTTWSDGFAIHAPLFWATQNAKAPSHLNPASSPSVLRLGVYLNGAEAQNLHALRAALKLALDSVNEDANVLPITRLELVERVTLGDKGLAVAQGKDFVEDDDIVGIVGATWSSVSIQISKQVASTNAIPMLSYASTNPALSETRAHPYFLRLCGSDSLQGTILADVIQKFGWRRAGVVYEDDEYARGLRTTLGRRASQLKIDLVDIGVLTMADSSGGDTLDAVVAKLAAASTSIIVLLTLSPLPFFRKASAAGNTGLAWQYIGTDGMASMVANAATSDFDALTGIIFTSIPASTKRKSPEFLRFSKAMYGANAISVGDYEHTLIHDAVKMYALVLHKLVSNTPPVPLSSAVGDDSATVVCPVTKSGLACLGQCRPDLAQELVCLVSLNSSCTSEEDCDAGQMYNNTCVVLDASDAVCPRHSFQAPPLYINCRAFRGSIAEAAIHAIGIAVLVALAATCMYIRVRSKPRESTVHPANVSEMGLEDPVKLSSIDEEDGQGETSINPRPINTRRCPQSEDDELLLKSNSVAPAPFTIDEESVPVRHNALPPLSNATAEENRIRDHFDVFDKDGCPAKQSQSQCQMFCGSSLPETAETADLAETAHASTVAIVRRLACGSFKTCCLFFVLSASLVFVCLLFVQGGSCFEPMLFDINSRPVCAGNDTLITAFPRSFLEAAQNEIWIDHTFQPGALKIGNMPPFLVEWDNVTGPSTATFRVEFQSPPISCLHQDEAGCSILNHRARVVLSDGKTFLVPTSIQGDSCASLVWPTQSLADPNRTCAVTIHGRDCVLPFTRRGMVFNTCDNSSGIPECPTAVVKNKYFGWDTCITLDDVAQQNQCDSGDGSASPKSAQCPDSSQSRRMYVHKALKSSAAFNGAGGSHVFSKTTNDPADPTFGIFNIQKSRGSIYTRQIGLGSAQAISLDVSATKFGSTAGSNQSLVSAIGYTSDRVPSEINILCADMDDDVDDPQNIPKTGFAYAVEAVNSDPRILPHSTVKCHYFAFQGQGWSKPAADCQQDDVQARRACVLNKLESTILAVDAAASLDNSPILGLGGQMWSSISQQVHRRLAPMGFPVGSGSASSPTLSDQDKFPLFFRTVASDVYQAAALAQLSKYQGWKSVCSVRLTTEGDYTIKLDEAFRAAAAQIGIKTAPLCPVNLDGITVKHVQKTAAIMQASGAKVFALCMYAKEVPLVFAELKKINMLGPEYVYIGTDTWNDAVLADETARTTSSLITQFGMPSAGQYSEVNAWCINKHGANDPRCRFNRALYGTAAHVHDCLRALMLAIDAAYREVATVTQKCDSKCLRSQVVKQMRSLQFSGMTGLVQWNGGNDRVNPIYTVLDATANYSYVPVGSSSPGFELKFSTCIPGVPPCCPKLSFAKNATFCECAGQSSYEDGAFRLSPSNSSEECRPCPVGARCRDGILYPKPGYWMSSRLMTPNSTVAKLSRAEEIGPTFTEAGVKVLLHSNGQIEFNKTMRSVRWAPGNRSESIPCEGSAPINLTIARLVNQTGGAVVLSDGSQFFNVISLWPRQYWYAGEIKLVKCPVPSACVGFGTTENSEHLVAATEFGGCTPSTTGVACSTCARTSIDNGIYQNYDRRCLSCVEQRYAFWATAGLTVGLLVAFMFMRLLTVHVSLVDKKDIKSDHSWSQLSELMNGAIFKVILSTFTLTTILSPFMSASLVPPLIEQLLSMAIPSVNTFSVRCFMETVFDVKWGALLHFNLTLALVIVIVFGLPLLDLCISALLLRKRYTIDTLPSFKPTRDTSIRDVCFCIIDETSDAAQTMIFRDDVVSCLQQPDAMPRDSSVSHVPSVAWHRMAAWLNLKKHVSYTDRLPEDGDYNTSLHEQMRSQTMSHIMPLLRPNRSFMKTKDSKRQMFIFEAEIEEFDTLLQIVCDNDRVGHAELCKRLTHRRMLRIQSRQLMMRLSDPSVGYFKFVFDMFRHSQETSYFVEDGKRRIFVPDLKATLYTLFERYGHLSAVQFQYLDQHMDELAEKAWQTSDHVTFVEFSTLLFHQFPDSEAPEAELTSLLKEVGQLLELAYSKVGEMSRDRSIHGMVVMITMAQPMVINMCVELITCVDMEGVTYVQSDRTLRCQNQDGTFNPTYLPHFIVAIVMLVSALVLLPVIFLNILKASHRDSVLNQNVEENHLSRTQSVEEEASHSIQNFRTWDSVLNRYGILFRYYPIQGPYKLFFEDIGEVTVKSFHYLWETLLLSRNGVLIVSVKFLPPILEANYSMNGKLISSCVVCLVLLLWLIMHVAYQPYGRTANVSIASTFNTLELVSLFLATLLVIVYPITAIIEEQRIQDELGGKQAVPGGLLPSEVVTLLWLFWMLFLLIFLIPWLCFANGLAAKSQGKADDGPDGSEGGMIHRQPRWNSTLRSWVEATMVAQAGKTTRRKVRWNGLDEDGINEIRDLKAQLAGMSRDSTALREENEG